MKALDDGVYQEPSKMMIREWSDIWLQDHLGDVKDSTAALYKQQVEHYIKPYLGAERLHTLKPITVQNFYKTLERGNGKEKKTLSAKSVCNIHGILHRMLQAAVSLEMIRSIPTTGRTLPRVEDKEIRPFDEAEIPQFIKAAEDDPFALLSMIDLFTGLRAGELLGLEWSRVNLDSGKIFVNKQLQRKREKGAVYKLLPLKNDKPRLKLLVSQRHQLLANYRFLYKNIS